MSLKIYAGTEIYKKCNILKKYILLILHREELRGKRVRNVDERETPTSCLLHTPYRECACKQSICP